MAYAGASTTGRPRLLVAQGSDNALSHRDCSQSKIQSELYDFVADLALPLEASELVLHV